MKLRWSTRSLRHYCHRHRPLPSTPPPNFDISTPQPSTLPMPETGTAGADIVALRRGVRRWRGLTMAIGAIAALLAAYVALTRLAPGFITAGHQSQPAVAA